MFNSQNNPPSFEEWLKAQGVVGKSENTNTDLRQEPVVNYLFEDKIKAENFTRAFKITAHYSRRMHGFSEEPVYKDPLKDKFAVLVQHDTTENLREAYLAELKKTSNYPRASNKIEEQMASIKKRLLVLTGDEDPASARAANELAKRLDKLNSLATNQTSGWDESKSTSAFHLSFQNYIALNMDILSQKELSALQETSLKIMGPNGEVSIGIKQDSNWWDYTKKEATGKPQQNQMDYLIGEVIADASHLVDGEMNRRVIDLKTPHGVKMIISAHETAQQRNIPRFFPDCNGDSKTDFIPLTTGGMSNHRTATIIWKRGVDQHNKPVPQGIKPHHYEFFQTEYNAGAGLEWAVRPSHNPLTKMDTTGVAWTVSTRPIKANWRRNHPKKLEGQPIISSPDPISQLSEYYEVMHDSIVDLIISQRLITLYKSNRPSDVTGDNQDYSDPSSPEGKAWSKYRTQINDRLNIRVDDLSRKGAPQTSGNCTVMSLKALTEGELALHPLGDFSNLSEDHWCFAKNYNADKTIHALRNKFHALEEELKLAKDKETASLLAAQATAQERNAKNLFEAISKADINLVQNIFTACPKSDRLALMGALEPKYRSTPLISAIVQADLAKKTGNGQVVKNLLEIADFLMSHMDNGQINSQDILGDTALHRAAWYQFTELAKKLIDQGSNLDIKNSRPSQDTPRGIIQGLSDKTLQQYVESKNPVSGAAKPLPVIKPTVNPTPTVTPNHPKYFLTKENQDKINELKGNITSERRHINCFNFWQFFYIDRKKHKAAFLEKVCHSTAKTQAEFNKEVDALLLEKDCKNAFAGFFSRTKKLLRDLGYQQSASPKPKQQAGFKLPFSF